MGTTGVSNAGQPIGTSPEAHQSAHLDAHLNTELRQSVHPDARQMVIALGSNQPFQNKTCEEILYAAARRIAVLEGVENVRLSKLVRSRPAGPVVEQAHFVNAVLSAYTTLAPLEVLYALQALENEFGRVRKGAQYQSGGPRTLDLDLIDYEGVVCTSKELTLPHPQALYRDFVISPLLGLNPNHVLANQRAVTYRLVQEEYLVVPGDVSNARLEDAWPEDARRNAHRDAQRDAWPEDAHRDAQQGVQSGTQRGTQQGIQKRAQRDAQSGEQSAIQPGTQRDAQSGGLLSLCATPIGNLGDITLRVLDTLKAADLLYCEDTRVTRKLATRFGIDTPLRRADAHKLPELISGILAELEQGAHLAFVSDAGTPCISDPGSLLVAAARKAGYRVEVLPGASALTTALATSGLKGTSHYFGGFFPRKQGAALRLLKKLEALEGTILVFFESNHRTLASLRLIAEVMPARAVVVARELTKLHEEVLLGTAPEVISELEGRAAKGQSLKGEVVILIQAQQKSGLSYSLL